MAKILKKTICGVLAATAAFGCLGMATACETSHPEVQIQISFEGETYKLNYTLFRKVAPATVEHFLVLAEENYYDGLCVHDYSATRLLTGGYSYENDALQYKNYYETVKSYQNFPSTVYTQGANGKGESTYTLCGEFGANKFEVTNGNKKENYGALTMYYTDKSECEDTVYVEHPEAGQFQRDYKYNSATSQFYISLTETEQSNSKYCTFATLNDDSVDTLKALDQAIKTYVSSTAAREVTVNIDADDRFMNEYGKKETFDVLASPVVIEDVVINKR